MYIVSMYHKKTYVHMCIYIYCTHVFLHKCEYAGADPGRGLWGLETPPPEVYQRSQKNDVLV